MSQSGPERDRVADHRAAALDVREAALAAREAALTAREKALAERMSTAHEILAAADERDAISDSRDIGGDTREQALDRAHFLATGDTCGNDLPMRRGAALDRQHAKGDREASHDDRVALTEDADDPERPDHWDPDLTLSQSDVIRARLVRNARSSANSRLANRGRTGRA